jgi:alkylation response protein AidB-like acyl-CoA dehydrogenase
MNLHFTPKEQAFREEVRAFIRDHYPAHLRGKRPGDDLTREEYLAWHRILAVKGWAAPSWPREWGGQNWSPAQKFIWLEENALAETIPPQVFSVGMVAPVIYTFGTEAQKQRFLPNIFNGQAWWCQGYSEPGAGSDLASVTTRAVLDGDHYVVNGQKTWTSLAQFADWGFFLVRTDPDARKPQEGISFLLIDMKSTGVTVRPIITIDGGHEVNDVFLDNVRVPLDQRIGEENKGWTYAKVLLLHERSGAAGVARSRRMLDRLTAFLSEHRGDDGRSLIEDEASRRKIADARIELAALEYTELRVLAGENAGRGPGHESSLLKVRGTELHQRITELLLDAVGLDAHHDQAFGEGRRDPVGAEGARGAAATYFNVRKTSIYGGSNEIQRNIMAKVVLGL